LSTPRARVFVFSFVLIFFALFPTEKLGEPGIFFIYKNFILPVIFKNHCPKTGIFHDCFCPACGASHGISRILHGDISGALNYNKLSPFVLY